NTPATTAGPGSVTLVDGHALAFRSYYAIRQLTNSRGRSVNAVYGFLRSLLRLLAEDGPADATVVAFDAPGATFRHEQYEEYKAGRAPTPDDLKEQIDTIREAVRLLGVHQIEVPGLEADDIIGTLATRCAEQGCTVEIVTSDRDAYQLVGERVSVRGLDRNDRTGPADIVEKYGVTVEQWVDYRALIGDSSDNIPGARGIGPVTASKLLSRYGTLDYVLDNLDDIKPPGAAKKIRESLEDVIFSRELSEIVVDADLECTPEEWAVLKPSEEELKELLLELEFHSILTELGLNEQVRYEDAPWPHPDPGAAIGFVLDSESALLGDLTDLAAAADGKVAVADDPASALAGLGEGGPVNAVNAKAFVVSAAAHDVQLEPGD
ncbi:MAG TPA: 5'-3' exonuclease H3TH domain-containing protein, partial [Deinococcales bacterium]|nr:5'-3' exonuclease H3TH domain-containing protein [Deinococcales bacterium]